MGKPTARKVKRPPEPPRTECDDCGRRVINIVGCPDGAEICQACFDAGAH